MNYKLIHNFLNKHFQEIESVILFGSYIDNPSKANDIDLLLMSNKFFYSSKESFIFENKKINVIKFNISEVFAILAKHYQQGDFYKLVFTKGIIIVDKNKDVKFVRKFIQNLYPTKDNAILAHSINEAVCSLLEYTEIIKKSISQIEFFIIASKIISLLIDYFLLSNEIRHIKTEKQKSRYFDLHFPIESKKIKPLIVAIQKNNQKKFLQELQLIINEFKIPIKEKYSSDLIFDDYSQSNLILFVENLFNFNEIKHLIDTIKAENKKISFYIYQVDEDNQEKAGCYIVFDNYNLEFENNKLKWIQFFQNLFSNRQYTFPYNNIFCYSEIKFIGKQNLQLVTQLLTKYINTMSDNKCTKETYLISYINEYILKYNLKIDDIYNYYLGKLNAKTRSTNYLTQNQKTSEIKFTNANESNEKIVVQLLKETVKIDFKVNFPIFKNVPVWFHFQVIDLLLSTIIKNDFQKLFYINCLKKINV